MGTKEIIDRLLQLDEMPGVGDFKTGGVTYKVVIYYNEGPVPHIHLIPLDSNKKSDEICIKLDSPEYFHHGSYQETLNHKERREFNNFMHSKHKRSGTNWDILADLWDDAFPNNPVKSEECPDYNQLH